MAHFVRPTQAELESGILAWLVFAFHTWNGVKDIPVYQPVPYTEAMLRRRHARGDSLPDFVTVNEIQPIKPLHVAIVGSRHYPHRNHVMDYVTSLPANTVIVSGGANGVDTWAEQAAKQAGLSTLVFPAEWDKYGKSAGFRRNADIVNAADRVVAFWDGKSKGTRHSIDLARKQGKPLLIVLPGTEIFDVPDEYIPFVGVA